MESFNRVLYFILGLVVVLVFIIVFTGRLNLGKTFRPLAGSTTPNPTPKTEEKKGFFSFLGSRPTATPTPTKAKVTPTPTPSGSVMTKGGTTGSQGRGSSTQPTTTKGGVSNVQSIPATGSPVEILYLAIPTLSAGLYLRKRS
jgi:hypothetical protein